MELTLYAQNNTNFLSNGSKLHFRFKLLYSTTCHKRSELFKYFSGLRCIAEGEKSVGGELLEHIGFPKKNLGAQKNKGKEKESIIQRGMFY